ncbi:MAG TPA: copper transporter [Streptosporangiaceae bacterium]|nr:copper transporter [Streptosporangiaceae bacterium]
MIDFRYHLVSIVAVFLALAIGIVLGSTELRGAALSALDRTSSALSAKLNAANSENNALQLEVSGDQSFAQAAEPVLLAHLLDGKRAVIITAPGAPGGEVSGLTTALGHAGATVSGQVSLTTKFADTSASTLNVLDQLTQQVVPSGVSLVNGSPQQQAAQVLASALLSSKSQPAGQTTSSQTSAGQAGSSPQTILSSYSAGGFLTVSGQPASGATLAVIVPASGNTDPANQAIVALAREFGTASQATVVAGASPPAGGGSAITAVRASGAANNASTVDNADTVSGQIVAVQALEQQLSGHKPGSYGVQPDAASAGPSPAPTASASATATAKAASGKGKK